VATAALGDASWITGNVEEARLAYTEAVRIGQAADNIHMVIIANSNLAHTLMELGRLHQAARIYSETLQMATHPDGQTSPLADGIYVGLSRVSYEWNRLEVAAQYTHRCIALCRQWENYDLLAVSYSYSGHRVTSVYSAHRVNESKVYSAHRGMWHTYLPLGGESWATLNRRVNSMLNSAGSLSDSIEMGYPSRILSGNSSGVQAGSTNG
jgi:hypothetical protein